jgi:hyperosmotically inducible periplasmic protein
MNMRTSIASIGIALFATVVACGPKERDYETMTKTALSRAGIENLTADYDSKTKVVHLTGEVPNQADRAKAGEVATQAVAPYAQVANEVTVQASAANNATTANDLDSGLSTRLENLVDEDQSLQKTDIDFDVTNGIVTIKGQVRTSAQKNRVEQLARSQPGVKDVVNSLEVKS